MELGALIDAIERAIELRGTVMLSLPGDRRRWCAVCAAVDGSVELRVGEPARGWRRWRPAAGEGWLRDHGFVHRLDAWSAPAPLSASARDHAGVLACALQEGLGVPEDSELVEVLVHPGLIGSAEPPPASAAHADHIRYAVTALAERGRGKVCIEGGRPAETWAWVFALDGELALSPEPPVDPGDYERDWTVSVDRADLETQAVKLARVLHDDLGRSSSDPLFISFMDP